MTSKEKLLLHYENWANTTSNQFHKKYAQTMLEAIHEGTYVEMFKELGSNGKRLYDEETGVVYNSVREAAKHFNVDESTMSINYLRYGLKRLFR